MIKRTIFITVFTLINSISSFCLAEEIAPECQNFFNKIGSLGVQVHKIQVPEDWRVQNGRQITVYFYSRNDEKQTPVIYFNGGPLGDSHFEIEQLEKLSTNKNLRFIYVDQRGTGCSSPVPVGLEPNTLARASLYSSDSIVEDAEVIRKEFLNDKKWKIFGHSYGTTISNRYLMRHPSAILSVHNFAGTFTNNFSEFFFHRIRSQQNVLQAIDSDYPGTLKQLLAAKASLTSQDCISVGSFPICGQVLLDAMFANLNGSTKIIKEEDINPLFNANGMLNLESIKNNFSFTFNFFFQPKFHSVQAVWRQEFESIGNNMNLSDDCDQAYRLMQQDGQDISQFPVDECQVIKAVSTPEISEKYKKIFSGIPIRGHINFDKIIRNIKNNNMKYYLYSTGMDGLTGYTKLFEFATKSKQVSHRHYPWLGHRGYYRSQEFWNDLAR